MSEPTVFRYLQGLKRRHEKNKAKRWLAFLNNHREIIAAFDFFTVPTLKFQTLYCVFGIEHGRRRVLHFNCTEHPTSNWIVQQLREALPLPCPYRYVRFDRDAKFGSEVHAFLESGGVTPKRTTVRSPWQNGTAERWVGSVRRELLTISSRSTRPTFDGLGVSIAYYHEDRTHIGLQKNTPAGRTIETRSSSTTKLLPQPRIGGIHHRYTWTEAA